MTTKELAEKAFAAGRKEYDSFEEWWLDEGVKLKLMPVPVTVTTAAPTEPHYFTVNLPPGYATAAPPPEPVRYNIQNMPAPPTLRGRGLMDFLEPRRRPEYRCEHFRTNDPDELCGGCYERYITGRAR